MANKKPFQSMKNQVAILEDQLNDILECDTNENVREAIHSVDLIIKKANRIRTSLTTLGLDENVTIEDIQEDMPIL